jgi:hypothetical protein
MVPEDDDRQDRGTRDQRYAGVDTSAPRRCDADGMRDEITLECDVTSADESDVRRQRRIAICASQAS